MDHQQLISEAISQAEKGLQQGGIPIGSVLVRHGKIVGRGHCQRLQKGSSILHAEMDAIENAGRQHSSFYLDCTLYTTLSPCAMCSGAVLFYKIPHVVVAEHTTLIGEEEHLRSHGVKVEVLETGNECNKRCVDMLAKYIAEKPEVWNEGLPE